jgi:hypothetical protein
MYDYDNDGFIDRSDVITLLNWMPLKQAYKPPGEGKYTSEEGLLPNYSERFTAMQKIIKVINHCF